jgi:hypothetical protein
MSEKAREVVREAILNYAASNVKPHTAVINRTHRAPKDVAYADKVLSGACKRSDDFEQTSVELMLAERGGDPAEIKWSKK